MTPYPIHRNRLRYRSASEELGLRGSIYRLGDFYLGFASGLRLICNLDKS